MKSSRLPGVIVLVASMTLALSCDPSGPPPMVLMPVQDGRTFLARCGHVINGDVPLGLSSEGEALLKGWCSGFIDGARTAADQCIEHLETVQGLGVECRLLDDGEKRDPLDVANLIRGGGIGFVPDDISLSQSIRIVVEYLQGHPESLRQDAAGVVWSAHQEAFPRENEDGE